MEPKWYWVHPVGANSFEKQSNWVILISQAYFPIPANWKLRMLQASEASTYTEKSNSIFYEAFYDNILGLMQSLLVTAGTNYLLCWPSLVPQITGGVTEPGEVTVKVSVKHCPIVETGVVAAAAKEIKKNYFF